MSGDQKAGQIHNIKADNSSFGRVEQFKYLGTTVMNQISIQEEMKSRLSQGILAVIQCRIIILSVALYGCETRLLILREERRLRCFRIGC